jgi:RHS repeat-associated protein
VVTGNAAPYTHHYFHANRQGRVIAMSDDSGAKVEGPYVYDPYGNCSSGGSACTSTGEPYRFTGRRLDPETGLYYYRARYYWPQGGRFLSTDPVGYDADLNLYTYVGNDPADAVDPTGDCPPEVCKGGELDIEGVDVTFSGIGSTKDMKFTPDIGSIGDNPNASPSAKPIQIAARGADPLRPDPNAEGPHSTFRRDSSGQVQHYETYEQNEKTGKYDPKLRFRGVGKPHGGVKTPLVLEREPGKGAGSVPNRARPALPNEIPKPPLSPLLAPLVRGGVLPMIVPDPIVEQQICSTNPQACNQQQEY